MKYSNLKEASLVNSYGSVVRPNKKSVEAAMNDSLSSFDQYLAASLILGKGIESWPICTYLYTIFSGSKLTDCKKASTLVDWLYWMTHEETSYEEKNYVYPLVDSIRRRVLSKLVEVTCNSEHVSALYGCVSNGTVCSQRGSCISGQCNCNNGWTGSTCEYSVVDSSSSTDLTAILLGVLLPSAFIVFCLIIIGIVLLVVYLKRSKRHEDWMIDYDQIEFGESIGTGGFGEVRKAVWRGTEVAVKTIASESAAAMSHEMRNKFMDEVRIMTALRHPNIVLFMGASTKAPHMCIVMEYMALGSLYDVLHNELIPEIPHELKIKMARQAARGMHYLHSAGNTLPPY